MRYDYYSDTDKRPMEKLANHVVVRPREEIEDLADKDFALIIEGEKRAHRQFPINDPQSTLLSALYFMKNESAMPGACAKVAGARIKEACFRFGLNIPSRIDAYPLGHPGSHRVSSDELIKEAAAQRESEKQNLPDEAFGLVFEKNGQVIRRFPMHDKEHVLKAIHHFPKLASSKAITEEQKEELAEKIAGRAEQFGIETEIAKKAQVNPRVIHDMRYRTRNLEPEVQAVYEKVAHMVRGGQITVKEASAVVSHLDKKHGIADYKRRMTPDEVIQGARENVFEKSASTREFVRHLLDGELEKTAAPATGGDRLEELLSGQFGEELKARLVEQFGPEMAEGLCENPSVVYDSLPKPHQEVIDVIIGSIGG